MLSADTSNKPSSGVYTCQTCNALFTCLDYYQQHRKHHAETDGAKLLTCAHCTYVSHSSFHFNWHIMSHASSPPHKCDVCASANDSRKANLNEDTHGGGSNDAKGRISDTIVMSDGKRSVATATSDDLIFISQLHSCNSPPATSNASKSIFNNVESNNKSSLNIETKKHYENRADEIEEEEDTEGEDEGEDEETDIECPDDVIDEQFEPNALSEDCDMLNDNNQQQQFFSEDVEEEDEEELNEEEEEENGQTELSDQNFNFIDHLKPDLDMGYETQIGDNMMNGFSNGSFSLENCEQNIVKEDHNGSVDRSDCEEENNVPERIESNDQTSGKVHQQSPEDVYEFNSEEEDCSRNNLITNKPSLVIKSEPMDTFAIKTSVPQLALPAFVSGNDLTVRQHTLTNQGPSNIPQPNTNTNGPNPIHSLISHCHPLNTNFIFSNQFPTPGSSPGMNSSNINQQFMMNPIRFVSMAPHSNTQPFMPNNDWNGANHFDNTNTMNSLAPTAKKSSKKAIKTSPTSENDSNNVSSSLDSMIITPNKGKGKGNRKPRINFISVVNGITVGADGIRRKFQCSLCGNGKSFKTKSHLQRHMLTHTGEKPYQCSECGSKFNQSSSLRNHIIAIHTKKFPHTCTICGKGFLMPAVLQKHIQTTGHQSEISPGVSGTEEMVDDNGQLFTNIDMDAVAINAICQQDHFIHDQNCSTPIDENSIKIKQEMIYILSNPNNSIE